MNTFNENLHPRGADGRWTPAAASPPAAALPQTPSIRIHHRPAPTDAAALEARREEVRHALDVLAQAEVTHVEARARDMLPSTPRGTSEPR